MSQQTFGNGPSSITHVEKFAGLKLFDLGKLKGVSTFTELENMYLSAAPTVKTNEKNSAGGDSCFNRTGGELNKRNKYFDH